MTAASYAAVDWGTSSFRLWIVSESGAVLAERRSGEGMTTAVKVRFFRHSRIPPFRRFRPGASAGDRLRHGGRPTGLGRGRLSRYAGTA